jgi:glycosyltransferase involved in cell wall biosynthesis
MTKSPPAPAITVLMSAYNAQDCIARAIESILSQTFTDFEFVIINDGSIDQTGNILERYARQDSRIKIHTQNNNGLTKALNTGLKLSRGEFIARQDCDDWSHPRRLEQQVEYMNAHPNVTLLGCVSEDVAPDGEITLWRYSPPEKLQKSVYLKTPFPHSSAFMRAGILRELGGYDESFPTAQDAELWIRFARQGPIAMLETPLIQRHLGEKSISNQKRFRQTYDALRARLRHRPDLAPFILYNAVRTFLIGIIHHKFLSTIKEYARES